MSQSAGRLIVLSGIDGSGKSSHLAWIAAALAAQGRRYHYIRLRWAALTSIPLLAIARLLGYSRRHYNPRSKTVVVEQRYDQWSPMCTLWPPLFTLDMALTAWWKVLLPLQRDEWVLCDRYVLDAIVDITATLRDEIFLSNGFAARLCRLAPPDACTIVLDIDPSVAFARKLDLLDPSYVSARRPFYLRLAQQVGVPVVDGNRSFGEVQASIAEIAGIRPLPEQRDTLPQGVA